jgi:hypothetical protein
MINRTMSCSTSGADLRFWKGAVKSIEAAQPYKVLSVEGQRFRPPPPPVCHSVQHCSTALRRAVDWARCCAPAGAALALARFVSGRAIAVGAVAHALPTEQTTFELVLCEKDKGKPTTLLVQVGGRAERDR